MRAHVQYIIIRVVGAVRQREERTGSARRTLLWDLQSAHVFVNPQFPHKYRLRVDLSGHELVPGQGDQMLDGIARRLKHLNGCDARERNLRARMVPDALTPRFSPGKSLLDRRFLLPKPKTTQTNGHRPEIPRKRKPQILPVRRSLLRDVCVAPAQLMAHFCPCSRDRSPS